MYEDVFKEIDKMNPDSSWLSEDTLSIVDEWIDTGCYILNAICSGSLYKGIPKGRITGFSGPSGCGKTLLINKIIGNFQKEDPDNIAVMFDTELASDRRTAISMGVDPTRVRYYPVDKISNLKLQISKLLDLINDNELQGKFIIAIDSLGNISGNKEADDILNNKDVADQGIRAKDIKSFLRAITYRAAKTNTAIVFANHEYSSPAQQYPSLIKDQGGGKGPIYLSSLLIQMNSLAKKPVDEFEDEELIPMSKDIAGKIIHILTIKNRFIPQFLHGDLWLNFKTGFNPYYGLFDIAKSLKVIEGSRAYSFKNEKLGFAKSWINNPEVWNMIFPDLELAINNAFTYSSNTYETLKKEIDNSIE